MPARNQQNTLKTPNPVQDAPLAGSPAKGPARGGGAGRCPACGAEVPPKPGFRFSSLKCPKCGASMGKK